MEEDLRFRESKSGILGRHSFKKQFAALESAVKEASDAIDYEAAHNPEIQYALDIVARFLKRKRRVCYGGTAINALLPKSLKFYDEEKELPDYDFFTNEPDTDINEIVQELNTAGFKEVNQRIGMHKGTHKILVNFMPIADITTLDNNIYKVIYKRSHVIKGIHYTDPDFLRMMMYLEISRPRGEVARWEKVFERLSLLNAAFPVKLCEAKDQYQSLEKIIGSVYVPTPIREILLDYILENKRILVGGDVALFYDMTLKRFKYHKPSIQWFLKRSGVMVFMSPDAVQDGIAIRDLFGSKGELIKIDTAPSPNEMVPNRVILRYKNRPMILIVQESACHSYNAIELKDSPHKLHIGSLETLITLYYSLAFFTEDETILQTSILCLCQKLVELSKKLYTLGGKGPIPEFSITCSGYQKGYASLLREKVARIAEEKKKARAKTQKRLSKNKSTTRKNKTS